MWLKKTKHGKAPHGHRLWNTICPSDTHGDIDIERDTCSLWDGLSVVSRRSC